MAGEYTDKSFSQRKIRVLLCVSFIDGHDRGLKYIAKQLVEAGMEVVYVTYEFIEEIVAATIQEDVDVVGVSSSTSSHMTLFPDLINSLKAKGVYDVLIIAGGIIPTADIPRLQDIGVRRVFGPGTFGDEVVGYILENCQRRKD